MADRDVITNHTAAVGFDMNKREVLNVGVFSDSDFLDIAAKDDAGPDAGKITDRNPPDDVSGRIDINFFSGFGRMFRGLNFLKFQRCAWSSGGSFPQSS